jgi:hypothetical protein
MTETTQGYSQESIEHIVRMKAGHDINHIQQIERILASEG